MKINSALLAQALNGTASCPFSAHSTEQSIIIPADMEDGFLQIFEDFILVYIQSLPNVPQTPEAALTPLLILKHYLVPSLFWRYSPCFRGLGAGSAQAFNTLQALSLPHSLQLPLTLASPHIAVHFDIHPLCTISPRPQANTTSSLGTSAWTVLFFFSPQSS